MKGFGYLVKEGFKNVYANRIMSIASVCVLVSCLVMTGAAALFSLNVLNIVDEVEKNNETSVYILKEKNDIEAKQIGAKIQEIENVDKVTFVSKHEAVEQFKNTLGDQLFDRIKDEDPLNDKYIVSFKDTEKYEQTVDKIKTIDGVQSVTDRRDFARKLTKVSNLVTIVAVCIVAALIVISLFIIANTIRTTMYSRRFEISIMKSVGATNMFVRMPFLVEGMILGDHDGVRNLLREALIVIPAIKFIADEFILRHEIILGVGRAVHADSRLRVRRKIIFSIRNELILDGVAEVVDAGCMDLVDPVSDRQRFGMRPFDLDPEHFMLLDVKGKTCRW